MKAKKEYYTNHVDRRTRIVKLVYLLIFLAGFCIVLYDSFVNDLPFYYILFLLLGRFMSLILHKTQKVQVTEADNKYTVKGDRVGLFLVIAVIILRVVLFPRILSRFNVVYISDASYLVLVGWFWGKIRLLSGKIEDIVFSEFLKKNEDSD